MSRKQATFGQLVDYMEDGRQDKNFTLKHNLYSNKAEKIKEEFEKNANYIKKRKNGVYMYHEVLSITKSKKLSDDEQKEILRDIALNYLSKRAQNNLAYAVLHDDKQDNLHYHLLISSNEVQEIKKHRLSKEQFDTIKKDLEKRVLEKYPELEQKEIINKNAREKLSNKGAELKRRTGETNQRDSVKNRLQTVFSSTTNKQSFFDNMTKENLEVYVRGNTIGLIDKETGRKHRLKSLDMLDEFNKISSLIEESEKHTEKKYEEKEVKHDSSKEEKLRKEEKVKKDEPIKNKHEKEVERKLSTEEIIELRKQEMKQERSGKDQYNSENTNTNKNKRGGIFVYDVVNLVKSKILRVLNEVRNFTNIKNNKKL